VEIKPYQQTKISVPVDKNIWDFMNEAEKIKFVQDNEPNVTIIRAPQATENTAAPQIDQNGKVIPMPTTPSVDENLKSMKVSEINRILSIVKKYESGQLSAEQAKQILSGYGLNEEQLAAWLNPNPDQSLTA
jgi:hypothetical protein